MATVAIVNGKQYKNEKIFVDIPLKRTEYNFFFADTVIFMLKRDDINFPLRLSSFWNGVHEL